VVFFFKELAKIGELAVCTNCGKPLKAANIIGFQTAYFLFNLSFKLAKKSDHEFFVKKCLPLSFQKFLLITPFFWGYPLWNKRMKRELLDDRILLTEPFWFLLSYSLFIRG
jgi:hypothetical protein